MIFWKRLWLVANITTNCNAACKWCLINYIDKKEPNVMSSKTIDTLLHRYKQHIEKYGFSKHNVFLFEGGEPLLYKDLVKEVTSKLLEIKPRIEFIDIFTNGILLDDDFLKWTKDNRVNIHFSAGDHSLSFIEDTLERISKFRKFAVLTVALSPKNLERLEDLIDVANKFGFHFRMRHLYQESGNKEYLELYDKMVIRALKRILDKGYLFYPYLLYEMTTPFLKGVNEFTHHCGKCYFIVDPNGDVRPCAIQSYTIGNIHDEDFEFVKNMMKSDFPVFEEHVLKIEECKECEFFTMCGGGCTFTKKVAYNGNIYRPSPFCETFKKAYPLILELGRRWMEAGRSIRF